MIMAKQKRELKKLNAIWNIPEAAMYLDSKKGPTTIPDLIKIYRGNFVPMLYDYRLDEHFKWDLSIEVIYRDKDGIKCTDKLEWDFNTPMTFKQMLHGNDNMFVTEAGLKTIWQGVGHEWTNYVTKKLVGTTIISAWAIATTEGYAKPINAMHRYTRMASKLNKDFKTGHYL